MLFHSNYHPIVYLQGQHGNKAFLLKYNSYFTAYQQQSYTHYVHELFSFNVTFVKS